MSEKNWTLISRTDPPGKVISNITPNEVGGAGEGYCVTQRRLTNGLSEGVDVVSVDNGLLKFDVLPSRGMNIHKAWIDGELIGWNSPVAGPVHPAFVPLSEPSGLGWLDGFDEWIARCGLESNGAPEFDDQGRLKYGLHGRISNKPAQQVDLYIDGDSGTIKLVGIVEETRFLFSKLRLTTEITTTIGKPGLEIHDTVRNLSASPADFQMLYHINFGPPLLDADARVVVPIRRLAPRDVRAAEDVGTWDRYVAARAGYAEQVYFAQLQADDSNQTRAVLVNSRGDRAASVLFNTEQLPCFSLWKNTTAEPDGCVTGLEPATNFPNPRSFEAGHGRAVQLAGSQEFSFDLQFEFHRTSQDVEQAVELAKALQQSEPKILDQPQAGWFSG